MEGLKSSGIEFILTKYENCAGFMAEGGYHADGAPGILVATLGPGVANAVNVVANAFQDRVPMFFITGCVDEREAMTYTHQIIDHSELLKAVTKASIKIVDGAVDVAIDKAVAIALDGQPGPVHVDLPISVAVKSQPECAMIVRSTPSPAAPAEGADLETARRWLSEAQRPVMIAGVDVLNQNSEETVAEFVRDFKVPLITTYKAKGVIPEDHPLALGGAGLSPLADQHLLPLVQKSDLIILAGYDPIEMRTGWRNPWEQNRYDNCREKVIKFCAVPNMHYMHQADLSFIGHVGEGLNTLRKGVFANPVWKNGEPEKVRNELKSIFSGTGTSGADEEWGPAVVIDVVRNALPRNGVATADSGAHRILLSQMWECYQPRGLLQSTALCTMGCAVPLAMGFQLAAQDRSAPDIPAVVAFVGDAGMEMVLGELATLRDLKLPVVIVVFIDESLALIELKQRKSELPNLGVDFGATNFPAVTEALGGIGHWISSRDELIEALDGAFERETFTLLACRIGEKVYDGRF